MKKGKRYSKHIQEPDFRVTIFGSARTKRGMPEYKMVHELGKMLGEEGIEIVTGGGPGMMEAASKGHKVGRGKNTEVHTIGLNIKLPFEQKINRSVDISREFTHFSQRLDNFMLLSNAIVVTPGGVGTLLELFYAWQLVQVKQVCDIPIILLGDMWPGLIKWIERNPLRKNFIGKKDLGSLFLAKNVKEAMEMIRQANREFKKGTKNYCLNYKKYKLKPRK